MTSTIHVSINQNFDQLSGEIVDFQAYITRFGQIECNTRPGVEWIRVIADQRTLFGRVAIRGIIEFDRPFAEVPCVDNAAGTTGDDFEKERILSINYAQ